MNNGQPMHESTRVLWRSVRNTGTSGLPSSVLTTRYGKVLGRERMSSKLKELRKAGYLCALGHGLKAVWHLGPNVPRGESPVPGPDVPLPMTLEPPAELEKRLRVSLGVGAAPVNSVWALGAQAS